MRCIDSVTTIGIEGFDTQIIREDQYDVGFIGCGIPVGSQFFFSDCSQSWFFDLNFWKVLYSLVEI